MESFRLDAGLGEDSCVRASRPSRTRGGLELLRFGIGLIALSAVTMLLTLALCASVIPRVMGWDAMSINSGSMEPLIGVGDMLLAEPFDDQELQPGGVIVFDDPNGPGVISHRLDSVADDGTIATRGDANQNPDSTPVELDSIAGVGRMVVPWAGQPTLWLGRGDWTALAQALVMVCLLLFMARWGVSRRFSPGRDAHVRSSEPEVLAIDPASWPPPDPDTLVAVLHRLADADHSDPPTERPNPPHDETTGIETVHRAKTTRRSFVTRGRPSGRWVALLLGTGSAVVVAMVVVAAVSNAAFTTSTVRGGNSLAADNDFSFGAVVLKDSPSFWWRLSEQPASGGQVFTEDFEGAFNWTTYNSGTLVKSTAQSRSGQFSGLKNTNNDPSGAWVPLGFGTGLDWTTEAWIFRPSTYSGGAADRIGVEDSSFGGYGVSINHGNEFVIERRDGGAGTTLSTVVFDPPEDAWYRISLARSGSNFSASIYSAGGALLVNTTAVDSTHGAADRFVVHGGFEYYIDDISVTVAPVGSPTVAVDSRSTLNGTYVNSPTLNHPSLVARGTNTAVRFNGSNYVAIGDDNLLNLTTRAQRSVELWFRADDTTGRQVLYEEGGGTNGMVVYLENATLRARAWSATTAWSNELDTTHAVTAAATYHVIVALDASGSRSLVLYVNGASVSTASKSDANSWAAHSDDGAIAAQFGSTRYHDASSATTGSYGFRGTIDDVAIYNTVLTSSRVQSHWIAGRP